MKKTPILFIICKLTLALSEIKVRFLAPVHIRLHFYLNVFCCFFFLLFFINSLHLWSRTISCTRTPLKISSHTFMGYPVIYYKYAFCDQDCNCLIPNWIIVNVLISQYSMSVSTSLWYFLRYLWYIYILYFN